MTNPRTSFASADRSHHDGSHLPQPRMLFRARHDLISHSLVRAVADCYIDYQVELVSHLNGEESGVALVAFQLEPDADADAGVAQLRHLYPEAVLTVLVSSPAQVPAGIDDLVGRGILQGVVPLTLSLSLWLAAFGLLLNGGIYLPSGVLLRRAFNADGHSLDHDAGHPEEEEEWSEPDGADRQDDLTNREQEVLKLLSMGFQNKIIASRMNLSEYTVKVHVHNIIRKLRVHNRTQAAAYWLGNASRRPDKPLD
ncbi:helix-turn-helix transcriptional regulator [Devosia salina]|uniref:Response regulator transcription factor n=1 Tax=Devosia salina TaxID=2860336 RepID=A0ABX8WLX5_9HYPH|nr:response regulator transcription factor [Devosia salina]QYO77692.1 response regulator transcription factor [Devosia salina]